MLARALRLGFVPANLYLQILALFFVHAHLVELILVDCASLEKR
jgi:hypothetical protein